MCQLCLNFKNKELREVESLSPWFETGLTGHLAVAFKLLKFTGPSDEIKSQVIEQTVNHLKEGLYRVSAGLYVFILPPLTALSGLPSYHWNIAWKLLTLFPLKYLDSADHFHLVLSKPFNDFITCILKEMHWCCCLFGRVVRMQWINACRDLENCLTHRKQASLKVC